MPKKMEPPPKRHHPSLADRVNGRAKVVTFYKSGDRNFKGIQIPIRKKYNFGTLLSDLDRVSNFPFGVRRIVTPSATHDVTDLNDFEDGKMYIMAPTKKKPKPLDLIGIQSKPPWSHMNSLPNSGTNSVESDSVSPRKAHASHTVGTPRSSESRLRTVKKIMVMRNGDPQTKHMMLLNRNKIPSFEAFLTDIGESFQLPAQKLFSSDGLKIESLSAIFNGTEDLFVVGTGVEKFRPGSYKENSPFKSSSRQRGSLRRKSMDDTDQPPEKIIKKSRGKFRVWVATSENPAAGTDAVVSLTVYGDKAKSDDIILGCGDGKFEAGNEDEFSANVGNIGDIYKIRIGHDDSTEFAGWLCEEVRLQDVHTGDEMVFSCGRWMSRQEDDGQTCRELPVMIDGNPVFPIVNYYVAVVTGNYWNAGTSAKVYMTVYGERGDTGPRLLHKAKRAKKFEKGKTDVFGIEAVSLGMLKKILIGHNSTDPDDGWFLEKVIVKEHKASSLESVFPCHCWLDATLDEDSKTSRELYVNNKPTNLEKEMWEQEKWKFQPGNQLVLINKGSGKAIQIKVDGTIEATVDPYSIQKTAIFEVQKVKGNVHTISSAANPDHCIAMDANKVFGKGKGGELKIRVQPDRSIVIESAKNSSQLLTFGQTGKPGDVRGHSLGPTRQFYCYVKGIFRDEGIVMFYTSRIQTLTVTSERVCLATGQSSEDAYWRVRKVGESGSLRMFESLAHPDSYLRIKDGHCDVQGTGDKFCHFRVIRVKDKGHVSLQSVSSSDVCVGFVPNGSVKPTVDTGEDNVRLYPRVIHFGTKKQVATPTPPVSAKPAVNRKKRVLTKQSGSTVKKAAAIPLTPTPTPSPLVREKSVYDDGDWKVWVKTGKVATKASVVLVVYGDDGVSQPFTLGKGGKELFKAGEENEFKVNVLSVGDIYKIRIGLDTASKKASWRLDQVKMKDMITDEQLLFKFKNRWLSAVEDDCDVWRELPAIRPGIQPLPINKYCIQVSTGNEAGSSTDANVYLCLYGEKGDTGKRRLVKSNHQDKFQESQMDMFELEAVTVMTPTKVIVGHDGKGSGAGWFLREVVVKESKTAKTEYVFPCNRWLDEGQDDKLIERELKLGEVREIKPYEWQVYVTTGSDNTAGTTAMVTLVAYGDKDMTEVALIPRGENGFQSGSTEDFRVYLGDIGQLYKIRIGHDNSAQDASWYLKTVRMLDLNENTEVQFEFDRWLSEKHDDLDVWREQPAVISGKKPLPVTRYYIQVFTGSQEDSGTQANVHLQLIGKNGDSGKRHLVRSKNNKDKKFLAGQMDVFEIEAVYLGRLQKVVVGHDGKEAGQGWFLEKVVVKDSKNAKNEVLFPCKKWLDAGQDDGKIQRQLVPGKPSSAPKPVTSESVACKTNSINISWKEPASGGVTGYRVTCDPPDAPASEVIITDAKTTKAEFSSLTAGKAYQFDIVATNGEIESEKVRIQTNAKPNQVVDAILESTTDTIIASWTHPEGQLSGYKVRISPADAKKSVFKIKDASKTRAEFTGLTPAKKYKVEVVTVSGEVESEKVILQETTKMPEIRVLKVPSAQASKSSSDSLAVSWTKPEGDVTGYRLMILPAESATPVIKVDGADKTTAEFTGLSSGQEYTVEVYTVYNDQESEKMTVTARTELAKVNKVRKPSAEATVDTITVAWKMPEGEVTGYRLTCAPQDAKESSGKEIKLDDAKAKTASFEGLSEGMEYLIKIYTVAGDRESDRVKVSATTKSAAVPTVTEPKAEAGVDSILVSWTKPDGNVTGYHLTCALKAAGDDATPRQITLDTGDATQATFDEMEEGKEYEVLIVAVYGERKSDGVSVSVQMKGKVNKVRKASIMETGTSSISISWKKPEGDISGYLITYSETTSTQTDSQDKKTSKAKKSKKKKTTDETKTEESTENEKDAEKQDSADRESKDRKKSAKAKEDVKEMKIEDPEKTQMELGELKSDVEYIIKIYALDGDRKSDRVKLTARTKPIDIPVVVNPAADSTADTVTITWTKPEGDNISGYHLTCSKKDVEPDNSAPAEQQLDNPDTCQSKFADLEPGTDFIVEIAALYGDKKGDIVSIDIATKQLANLSPVQDVSWESSKTSNSVIISWKQPLQNNDTTISGYRLTYGPKEQVSQEAGGVNKEEKESEDKNEAENGAGNGAANAKDTQVSGADTLSAELSDLEVGQTYLVTVFAVSDDGRESQGTSLEVVPKVVKVNKVRKASIVETGTSSISISWKKPEGGISGYLITYSETTSTQTDSQDKKTSKTKKSKKKKKTTDETKTEESTENEKDAEKQDSADRESKDRKKSAKAKEDVKEMKIEDPEKTQVELGELKSDVEYIIKIYALDGDRKSDRVKLTARTTAAIIAKVLDPHIENTSTSTITVSWKKPDVDAVSGYRLTCLPQDHKDNDVSNAADGDGDDEGTKDVEVSQVSEGMINEEPTLEIEKKLSETEDKTEEVGEKPEDVHDKTEHTEDISALKMILDGGDITSATFEGLEAGTEYRVSIYTRHGDNESESVVLTASTNGMDLVPCVEDVSAASTSNTITVSWVKPQAEISGLRLTLQAKRNSGNTAPIDEKKLDDPEVTSADFEGLLPETEYKITVYTVLGDQESKGVEVIAETNSQSNQPKDPTASSTLTTIDVSWTRPEGSVTGYRVLCSPADAVASEVKIEDGDTTQAQFEGLTPGREYRLEIYALNAQKESDKTTLSQTTKPNAVVDAGSESNSPGTISLTWTRPDGDLNGYRIDYQSVQNTKSSNQSDNHKDGVAMEAGKPDEHQDKPDEHDQDKLVEGQEKPADGKDGAVDEQSPEMQTVSIDSADTTKTEVTGLTPGQSYWFSIVAVSGKEESEKVTINSTAMPGKVIDPQIMIASEALTFTWSPPVGTFTGYRVACAPLSGEMGEPCEQLGLDCNNGYVKTLDVSCGEISVEGLDPENEYKVEIWVLSGEKEGLSVTLRTKTMSLDKPIPVQEAMVQSMGSSLAVSWTTPDGAIHTAYKITCRPSNSADDAEETRLVSHPKTSVSFSGLSAETEYVVQIIAVAGNAESESLTKSARTESGEIPELEKPEGDEVQPATPKPVLDAEVTSMDDSLLVTWRMPEGSVSGFKVVCKHTDTDTELIKILAASKTTASFGGLNTESVYTVEVYTVSGAVESEAVSLESKPTSVKQNEEDEDKETEHMEKPSSVLDASLTETTDSSLCVSWKKPAEPITGFRLECKKTDSNQSETRILDQEKTTAKFSALEEGTEYVVEIFSVNKMIESEGVMLTGQTNPLAEPTEEQPQPVTKPRSESKESALTLSWERPISGPVTGYQISFSQPAQSDDPEIRILSSQRISVTFRSLEADTDYIGRIVTLSGNKQSQEVTVEGKTLSQIQREKPQPVLEAACETTPTSLKVSWKKPSGPVTGYKILLSPKDNQEDPEIRVLNAEKTLVEFGSLVGGRAYLVGILTLAGVEESQVVQVEGQTPAAQKPLPVLDPKTKSTTDTVTVQWTSPDCHYTGFRIVCNLKSSASQNALGVSENNPSNEKPEEDEAKSNLGNQNSPRDETAPSAEEKPPVDSKPDEEDSRHVIEEKKVAADVMEVEFTGLDPKTQYSFDIHTVCDEVESEAVSVDQTTKKIKLPTQGEWKLWVTTSEDSKPTHDACVHVVVYGNKGKTEPIKLPQENQHSCFQAGSTDEFDINVGEIGDIYKIRIGHDDDNDWQGWHLMQVKMVDQHSEEELVFDFNRWMSRQEDDFDVVRELPAVREDQDTLPVNVYHLCVSTGDRWAAYTDAKMWIVLHGERGDSGRRVLYHSLNHPVKYMKGQMDEFKVEAVSLDEVSLIEIGHDGVGYGAGIFINSVSVRESETADKEYLFACNSWLDDHMQDRQTHRQLQLLGERPTAVESKDEPAPDTMDPSWKALIHTGDAENAGSTANVYLTVFGQTGRSPRRVLQGKAFEPDTEQEFDIEVGDIGEITKIRLEHDNSGDSPSWFVQQVRLVHQSKPELVFRVNSWLSSDRGDNPSTIREIAAIRAGIDPPPVVQYTVQVYIKEDPDSASTLPGLHVALVGDTGEMAKRELIRTSEPVSEDGKIKVDTFHFEAISIGKPQQATLTISSQEKQDTWFVEKVTVQEGKYAKTRYVFPCKMWFGNAIIGQDGNTALQTDLQVEGEEAVPEDNTDANDKDDGESTSKGRWTLWITPGKEDGMGTNSNLSVEVYGEKGSSRVIPLKSQEDGKAKEDNGEDDKKEEGKEKSNDEKEGSTEEKSTENEEATGDTKQDVAFPPGCVKEFDVEVGEIGPIYKIRLMLDAEDDKEDKASIFLEKVKMKDKDTNQEFHFFINRWLGRTDDIQESSSEVTSPKQDPSKKQEETNDRQAAEKKRDGTKKSDKKKASKAGKSKDKKAEKAVAETEKSKGDVNEANDRDKEETDRQDRKDDEMDKTQSDQVVDFNIELPAIRPDIPPLPVYRYELSVCTGDKGAASLDSVVYATVYGDRGNTGRRLLRKSNNPVMFSQGQVDVFTIEAVDILRPTSVTIGHQSEGLGAGWYLDKVKLRQSAQATTQYVFPCKRWLDTGVEDRHLERNLPLLGEVECPSSVTSNTKGHWQVRVKTSQQADGGTTANVCLMVYGEKGRCSRHPLDREAFQPGTEEEFQISVGDIGPISKICLEHDNSGDSPAWRVDSLKMKDVDSNEELEFKINRWLARDQDDGQICHEVPAVRDGQESLAVHNYQVKVHTGDHESAGTEGAIHVTLHGTAGDSGQWLLGSSNNAQKFSKGQVETFTVRAVDLAKIHSISVHNTSQDPSQAWYLDKIIVKTSPKAEQEFVFLSSQWIGAADAEKEELQTAENDVRFLLQEKWKCTVHTSDLPECGTNANVSLVAYGNNGMSKVMTLTNGQEGNFQPGKSADFELEPGAYVGDIYKIRVELQDGKHKSWHLQKIDLQDCFSDECLTFEYNGWLSGSQTDGKGDSVIEIPVLRPGQDPLPVIQYNLQVFTGEVEDAGTDSEISITLFGERGDTGRRLLNKPKDGDKAFDEPRKKDVFDIAAVSVGQITRVLIHKVSGKPWYLDKLIVKAGEFAAMETEFKHESWVGETTHADQPVDVELTATDERPSHTVAPLPDDQEPLQSKGTWKVFVTTGEAENAGIEANVTLTVYGSEGTSKPLPLGQDGQPTKMEAGQTQEFQVNIGEVGHIYKVRLEHDGKDEQSAWLLEKMKMKDADTKAEFSYVVSRWLSRDQEGCDRVVEMPAIWPETPILPVVKYDIQVLTGEEDDAGTQANVYITLRGEHGDTGRRDLVRQPGDQTIFSKGQMDRFTLEAVSLGKIDKCIVGHDGSQPDLGWFLEKIVVRESGENAEDVVFPCSRWLAVDKGDNVMEVELDVLQPSQDTEGASSNAEDDGQNDAQNEAQNDAQNEAQNDDKEKDEKAEDGQEDEKTDDQ